MEKDRVQEQADEVVNDHLEFMAGMLFANVERERLGEGCGCPSCQRRAVDEVNSLINWLSMGSNPKYEYYYDAVNRRILRPEDMEGFEGEDMEDTYE